VADTYRGHPDVPAGCKWLGVIDGATRMNFADHGLSRKVEAPTARAIGAFSDGMYRRDCVAPQAVNGMVLSTK